MTDITRITVIVAAAVVERDGRFLVTRRQRGVHLAGFWEFPGGKCVDREPLEVCLARELEEELAVSSEIGPEILTTVHDYSGKRIELHFFECQLKNDPTPQLGQEMRWVDREELAGLEFPPADAELIQQLKRTAAS